MTVVPVNKGLLYAVAADTKPSTYADGTILIETDTGRTFKSTSGVFTQISGRDKAETLSNKTMDTVASPIYGAFCSSINTNRKKFGIMHGNTNGLNNWGCFAGTASSAGTVGGTQTYNSSEPSIPYPMTTSTTSGTQARIQWPKQTNWANGPRCRMQFKLSTTTAIRFFIGWTTNTTFPSTDTFFSVGGDLGMGIGKRSIDTALCIYSNDGTGSMSTQALSPQPTDTAMTSPVTYEMWVDPVADTFNFTHDGRTTIQSFPQSSNYPTDSTLLSFVMAVGTSATGAKTFTMYTADAENV